MHRRRHRRPTAGWREAVQGRGGCEWQTGRSRRPACRPLRHDLHQVGVAVHQSGGQIDQIEQRRRLGAQRRTAASNAQGPADSRNPTVSRRRSGPVIGNVRAADPSQLDARLDSEAAEYGWRQELVARDASCWRTHLNHPVLRTPFLLAEADHRGNGRSPRIFRPCPAASRPGRRPT